jgi:hypothetical protein
MCASSVSVKVPSCHGKAHVYIVAGAASLSWIARMSEPWDIEPTDDMLGDLLIEAIREYYHEGLWDEIVEMMDTVKNNERISRYIFFKTHGFLSEVYDWYYNGEGSKDNVRMFDFDMRRKKEENHDRD